MRLVYKDPIAELKILVSKVNQYANVSHIALTATELRACLENERAVDVFPTYIAKREAELKEVRKELHALRVLVHNDEMPVEEKQPHFDKMDELQEREEQIRRHLPKMIREGDIVFKVSMH